MKKRIVLIACSVGCGPPLATPPTGLESVEIQPEADSDGTSNRGIAREYPEPTVNPPPPEPSPTTTQEWPSAELTDEPFPTTGDITSVIARLGRDQIFRTGQGEGDCVVFNTESVVQRPVGDMGPATQVTCPPELADPVFALCGVGMLQQHGDTCGCRFIGNPPPPTRSLSRCPVQADVD